MVICRMGAISQTSAVARNLPAQRRGCSIQSSRISRSGNPEASPRDTSSRSARVSASRERQRAAGEMPPRGNNKHRIELCGLSKARPISCSDCPAFHRLQILFFSTAENPNRFPSLMQHHLQRAALYQMVLRRLIETLFIRQFGNKSECLTNIHRHSGSKSAEIKITCDAENCFLQVRDFGRGISPSNLEAIRIRGAGVGISGNA
jgi:hypothetical protein